MKIRFLRAIHVDLQVSLIRQQAEKVLIACRSHERATGRAPYVRTDQNAGGSSTSASRPLEMGRNRGEQTTPPGSEEAGH